MLISTDNWEDVRKYYKDTYVKFTSEGDTLYKVVDVSSKKLVCTTVDSNEQVYVDLSRPYLMDFMLPGRVMFQYSAWAVQVSRIPARMYKKGISDQNTMFSALGEAGIWNAQTFSSSILQGFVQKPHYLNFEVATQLLSIGDLSSAALNSRMALAGNGAFFIDSTMVGKYEEGVLKVKKVFLPDVSQAIPNVEVQSL